MSRAAAPRQADVTRALKAASAAGLKPSGYSIAPDGTIHVTFGNGQAGPNSFDELVGDSQ